MSRLMNRVMGNFATRMMLIIYVSIVLITSFFIIFSYYNELELQERRQYDKLSGIASSMAVNIDGDKHFELMNRYESNSDSLVIRADSSYIEISKKMGEIVVTNQLSPMYTIVYNEELDKFVYGIRSDDYIDYKNQYAQAPKELKENWQTGGILPMYMSENGTWISAFHPIKNARGEVVAVVEVDIEFSEFQTLVNERYQKEVMIALAVIVLIALLLIPYARKVLQSEEKQRVTLMNQKLIIESKNRDLMDSIRYALRIQSAILPKEIVFKKNGLEGFIFHRPKDVVAGDFYWIERHGDDLFFSVADCTGHGVPGAILSLICSNSLNRAVDVMGIRDPGKILDACRDMIIKRLGTSEDGQMSDGMDISLCRLNLKTNVLEYAAANNSIYLYTSTTKEMQVLKPCKQPVGCYPKQHPFACHQIQLQKGDFIYLFTDGFADQFGGPQGKKFKYNAFKNIILKHVNAPITDQRIVIENSLLDWMNDYDQVDDICVMGVRI